MPLFPDQPAVGPSQTVQTVLAADTTTTSTSFVNLLTHLIAVQEGSYLLVRASFSTSDSASSSSGNQFRLTVDDVAFGYAGAEVYSGCSQSGSVCAKVGPLTGGFHTVNLDWQTVSGNTLQCRPVTQQEQATLISTEITDYQVGG